MKKTMLFLMFSCVLLFSVKVHAIVIDFESLGAGGDDGPTYLGTDTYSEDGYILNTDGELGFLRLTQTDSIALFYGGSNTITITKDDEGTFELLSIDYLHLDGSIEFLGTQSDDTTVNYTKIVDLENMYSTIVFPDFTDLISVSWQGGAGYNYFDNINVVPEPATILLLTLGAVLVRKR